MNRVKLWTVIFLVSLVTLTFNISPALTLKISEIDKKKVPAEIHELLIDIVAKDYIKAEGLSDEDAKEKAKKSYWAAPSYETTSSSVLFGDFEKTDLNSDGAMEYIAYKNSGGSEGRLFIVLGKINGKYAVIFEEFGVLNRNYTPGKTGKWLDLYIFSGEKGRTEGDRYVFNERYKKYIMLTPNHRLAADRVKKLKSLKIKILIPAYVPKFFSVAMVTAGVVPGRGPSYEIMYTNKITGQSFSIEACSTLISSPGGDNRVDLTSSLGDILMWVGEGNIHPKKSIFTEWIGSGPFYRFATKSEEYPIPEDEAVKIIQSLKYLK